MVYKGGKRLIKNNYLNCQMKKNPYYVASGGIEPLGHYHSHNSIKDAITIVCAGSIGNVFFIKKTFGLVTVL
ncbi:hypothetical protein CPX_001327 [Candidatus Phytoplasma pruni]|uniref:Uncharacterized protein n=2 Tax=Candidatus Phytoplasma pruni TaxID=479893 RepID=A0A0M1N0E7_9MOLU|nr:hypothetical protein CPX_001327 [Candidatus Phytoplasma pruni]